MSFKPSGPTGAKRPFIPKMNVEEPAERIAHALEHIAVALSAIDHNVEAILMRLRAKQGGAS